jgi:2-amino-4-hydroxy-6-hydroxymethyldihydropteridine diphosphokinase
MRVDGAVEAAIDKDGRPLPGWAWLGVGSNLGDRRAQIARAFAAFGDGAVAASPLYETEPWGLTEQPWFLNGIFLVRWAGSARALLDRVKAIEVELGRLARVQNGPRELDLDILVLGATEISDADLDVPHPGIASRRSVLEPWADLVPTLRPTGHDATLAELRARIADAPGQGARLFGPLIG